MICYINHLDSSHHAFPLFVRSFFNPAALTCTLFWGAFKHLQPNPRHSLPTHTNKLLPTRLMALQLQNTTMMTQLLVTSDSWHIQTISRVMRSREQKEVMHGWIMSPDRFYIVEKKAAARNRLFASLNLIELRSTCKNWMLIYNLLTFRGKQIKDGCQTDNH